MVAHNYRFNRTLPTDVSQKEFFDAIKHLYPNVETHQHKIQTWTYIFREKSAYFNTKGMVPIHAKFDEYVRVAQQLKAKKAP
jgi:hypothetical protein